MGNNKFLIKHAKILLEPDSEKVILRSFIPKDVPRITNIISRVMTLTEQKVRGQLNRLLKEFSPDHENIEAIFKVHYNMVSQYLFTDLRLSEERMLLIGACFTGEYAFESSALFNPSIVYHPDQSNLPAGSVRFIMSLRATGEGHVSSLTFRVGIIGKNDSILIDDCGKHAVPAMNIKNPLYDKKCFIKKLSGIGIKEDFSFKVLNQLKNSFTFSELEDCIKNAGSGVGDRQSQSDRFKYDKIVRFALSDYDYEIKFPPDKSISDFVIFPNFPTEQNGIEDVRFVLFNDKGGSKIYYATYTAYDGRSILPRLLETKDFYHFKTTALKGKAVENKGMALFPRKINGKYAMLSRQDNENLFIMYSDDIRFWDEAAIIMKPFYVWEIVNIGNCGSPIETDEGWIVLTHGVGPMRKYCIGAVLLDRDNPAVIIGRMEEPIVVPEKCECEKYVPNVVYSCGGLLHNKKLILPYAMFDRAVGVITVDLKELLNCLKTSQIRKTKH
jgi:predicted GH43/DUF377 family glycosyl hydrolase